MAGCAPASARARSSAVRMPVPRGVLTRACPSSAATGRAVAGRPRPSRTATGSAATGSAAIEAVSPGAGPLGSAPPGAAASGCRSGQAATSGTSSTVCTVSPASVVQPLSSSRPLASVGRPITARSRCPSRRAASIRAVVSSVREKSMPGCSCRNAASVVASPGKVPSSDGGVSAAPATMPSRTCPRCSPPNSWAVLRAASAEASAARACGRTASPAGVSRTVRPERSSSWCPSSRSSCRIWELTPGWVRCSSWAARVKLPCWATVAKYWSCRSSITVDYRRQKFPVLDG